MTTETNDTAKDAALKAVFDACMVHNSFMAYEAKWEDHLTTENASFASVHAAIKAARAVGCTEIEICMARDAAAEEF